LKHCVKGPSQKTVVVEHIFGEKGRGFANSAQPDSAQGSNGATRAWGKGCRGLK